MRRPAVDTLDPGAWARNSDFTLLDDELHSAGWQALSPGNMLLNVMQRPGDLPNHTKNSVSAARSGYRALSIWSLFAYETLAASRLVPQLHRRGLMANVEVLLELHEHRLPTLRFLNIIGMIGSSLLVIADYT